MAYTRHVACAISLGVALLHQTSAAQVKYTNGVFVAIKDSAPTKLTAYAELNSRGLLRMQSGSIEDAPTVHEIVSVLCSIPLWRPTAVLITTSRIFRDELAEQRQVVFASQALNVYATGLRVVDLERREKVESLLKSVQASYDTPGYAFVVLVTEGNYRRYYPIRLTPQEK